MTAPKLLAVCADDFGLSSAVSDGIVQLAQERRITAVSCMTNMPHWKQSAPSLASLPTSVGVGLHINLTQGRPLSAELASIWPVLPTLSTLMVRAHLGLIPVLAVQHEIQAQWAEFVSDTGREPMYVDGHQHVHQFPGIRKGLFAALEQMKVRPAMRNTARLVGPGSTLKRWIIRHAGARQLEVELERRNIAHNTSLVGAYGFDDTDYRSLMQAWLAALPSPGGLLFCHPGLASNPASDDPIGAARQREFAYLASEAFRQDMQAAYVVLVHAWP